jgi:hypothetical protein
LLWGEGRCLLQRRSTFIALRNSPKIDSPARGVNFSWVLSTVKFKTLCVILPTSGEKAHPLGESVEWAFSLAFFVFYDISAYFIVFLFRFLGLI